MIVTFLNQETLGAKEATASIPIVMVLGVNPVEAGLVVSLAARVGQVINFANRHGLPTVFPAMDFIEDERTARHRAR